MESLPENEITIIEKIEEKKEKNKMDTTEDTEDKAKLSFFGFPSTLTGLAKTIHWMMFLLIFLGVAGGTLLMCFAGFKLHLNYNWWIDNRNEKRDFVKWIEYLSMTTGAVLNLVSFFLTGMFLKNRRKLIGTQKSSDCEELRSAAKLFHNFFSDLELVAVTSCVILLSVYLVQGWDQVIPWIVFLVFHLLTFIPSFIRNIKYNPNWRTALMKYRYTFFGLVNLTCIGLVIWQHLKYPIPVFIPLILISYFLGNFFLVLDLGFLKVLHTLDVIESDSTKYNV